MRKTLRDIGQSLEIDDLRTVIDVGREDELIPIIADRTVLHMAFIGRNTIVGRRLAQGPSNHQGLQGDFLDDVGQSLIRRRIF